MITAIAFLVVTGFLIYHFLMRKPSNFPPGPTPFPIVGNIPAIGVDPHLAFESMSKEYGPIVGVKFGPDKAICVHGTKLIKEAFNEPAFTGRQHSEAKNFIFGDEHGIVSSEGETWTEQRRFALRHLRDFGFGKSSMEELIMDEVNEFSDWLRRQKGQSVSLQERFALAVVNSLWKILSGERFDHDDAQLHKILVDLHTSANALFGFDSLKSFLVFFYPDIAKMFPTWSGWSRIADAQVPRMEMYSRIIQEHKDTLQEDAARDFVDIYLQEIKKTTKPTSSFNPKSAEKSLKSIMGEFFVAGTDTTSVTLSWLNVYLLHNPPVQMKLHQELDRVVGRTRPVTLSDRKNLVYTEAVILETLRLSSIAPVSVPHAATEDVNFHGYDIPKGTIIFANLYANHHDPEIWGEDVKEFRPERFLSPDETTVIRHEALMPFSTGRRVCLGETLARDSLFLFAANLALNFEVTVENGKQKPTLEISRGITLGPLSSTVLMKERTL